MRVCAGVASTVTDLWGPRGDVEIKRKGAVRPRGIEPAPRRRAAEVADHWASARFCLDLGSLAFWGGSGRASEPDEEVQVLNLSTNGGGGHR